MKIKICGLMRLFDVDAVNAAMPDYAGFIFAPSRRQISFDLADLFRQRLNPKIETVGVFGNASLDRIAKACNRGIIDMVQLHGDEDAAYIDELKRRISVPIIKAVRVRSTQQIVEAQAIPCEYLLLDTYDKDAAGGTGKMFDWAMIPTLDKPHFLAGGLHAGNIRQAVKSDSYCLDISSGVETDGKKDAMKINEVVKLVRRMRT